MSEHQVNASNWEEIFEQWIALGLDDDEIVDRLNRVVAQGTRGGKTTRSGELLYWIDLHDRRRILALLDATRNRTIRGQRRDDVTREDVLAKQAELMTAGEPHGVGSLARALNVSETTVRRRLGRIK